MGSVKQPAAEESLEELLDRVQPRLQATLARYRIPFEDAEDLLQQALLTYLHKQASIQEPESWLIGTLRNRCLMYWRTRRRALYESVDTAILESLAESQRPSQEAAHLERDLENVLSGLPYRCRALFHLRYHVGLEPAEAAEKLGYRTSGIYKILERCLAALTRSLVAMGLVEERHARRG